MRLELILPIASMHGKITTRSNYYFRTINGKVYAQRCPKRNKPPTPQQLQARALFKARQKFVSQMQLQLPHIPKQQLWHLAIQTIN